MKTSKFWAVVDEKGELVVIKKPLPHVPLFVDDLHALCNQGTPKEKVVQVEIKVKGK